MSEAPQATTAPGTRSVVDRETAASAPARCACYAAWSELVASPHDLDPRASLRQKIGAGAGVEYGTALDALLSEFADADLDTLKREYSGLFEVGSDGPPVPIREDLQTGQRGGTREDLVRFYNYFNYKLGEKFAWAPDHLSVELEFMHYLCYREATTESDVLSYQLAQVDFTERHLVGWIPRLATSVDANSPESQYSRIVSALHAFVIADYDWQRGTIVTRNEPIG